MFYLIYNTATKYIITASNNTSSGISETLQNHLTAFVKLNKLKADEHGAVELPYDEDLVIKLGRDMFNSETNTIYPDPNWVPPAPEPAPTEPTE
jgi:hypothetical protein